MQHLSAFVPLFGSDLAAQKWLRMVMFRDELEGLQAQTGSAFTRVKTEVYTESGPWNPDQWYDVPLPRLERLVVDYSSAPSGTAGGLMGLGKVLGSFPSAVGEINATVVYKF
jgi:hypothetical protein